MDREGLRESETACERTFTALYENGHAGKREREKEEKERERKREKEKERERDWIQSVALEKLQIPSHRNI